MQRFRGADKWQGVSRHAGVNQRAPLRTRSVGPCVCQRPVTYQLSRSSAHLIILVCQLCQHQYRMSHKRIIHADQQPGFFHLLVTFYVLSGSRFFESKLQPAWQQSSFLWGVGCKVTKDKVLRPLTGYVWYRSLYYYYYYYMAMILCG